MRYESKRCIATLMLVDPDAVLAAPFADLLDAVAVGEPLGGVTGG